MFSELNEEVCEGKIKKDRENLYNQVIEFLYNDSTIRSKDIIPIGKPPREHRNCCYCADCNYFNDECVCNSNAIIEGIQKIFKGYFNYDSL